MAGLSQCQSPLRVHHPNGVHKMIFTPPKSISRMRFFLLETARPSLVARLPRALDRRNPLIPCRMSKLDLSWFFLLRDK